MFQLFKGALQVGLVPEDVETAQVAGAQFARTLAGALTMAFVLALASKRSWCGGLLWKLGWVGR